jgi:hypothetical protein
MMMRMKALILLYYTLMKNMFVLMVPTSYK